MNKTIINRRELLLISVGVFLTVIALLLIDVYNLRNQTQAKENPNLEVKDYKIDVELLKTLEQKTE